MPASTSGPTGCRVSSSAVTTPKLPPPPRSAHSSSGFSVADARTRRPSAVTSSAASRLSQARPCLRSSQPEPPPSVRPATPVVDTRPPVVARPCSWVARSSCAQVAPPPTRATRRVVSTSTASRPRTSMTTPSHRHTPVTEWPPARTDTSRPRSRAKPSASATSSGEAARATYRGRRSTIALKSVQASSYAGEPGSCRRGVTVVMGRPYGRAGRVTSPFAAIRAWRVAGTGHAHAPPSGRAMARGPRAGHRAPPSGRVVARVFARSVLEGEKGVADGERGLGGAADEVVDVAALDRRHEYDALAAHVPAQRLDRALGRLMPPGRAAGEGDRRSHVVDLDPPPALPDAHPDGARAGVAQPGVAHDARPLGPPPRAAPRPRRPRPRASRATPARSRRGARPSRAGSRRPGRRRR